MIFFPAFHMFYSFGGCYTGSVEGNQFHFLHRWNFGDCERQLVLRKVQLRQILPGKESGTPGLRTLLQGNPRDGWRRPLDPHGW